MPGQEELRRQGPGAEGNVTLETGNLQNVRKQ